MRSVFITGAEGFFGSNLAEFLIKKKYKVKALVQYNSFQSMGWLDYLDDKIKKKISIVFGDIRDKELLEKYINKQDIVINLAALIAIPYSYQAPRSYMDTNILGTLNLLEIAKEKKVSKYIQTSTSEVYGSAKFIPMTEKHQLNPQSPYAASKLAADHLAMSYYYSYNLPITILRPFNMFGPRQSPRAVIPTIITQIINSKNGIIKLGNILSTRDYTYVLDTAMAFEKSLKNNKINGMVINIGSGFEVSVKEIVKYVSKILNKKVKIITESKRMRPKKSEVNRLYSSNYLAKKNLNWSPRYSGKDFFKKGLAKTIDWYLKNNHLFKNSTEYKI